MVLSAGRRLGPYEIVSAGSSMVGPLYDIAADGQRFLVLKEGGADGTAAPASIVVVQHWVEELKRLVPTK